MAITTLSLNSADEILVEELSDVLLVGNDGKEIKFVEWVCVSLRTPEEFSLWSSLYEDAPIRYDEEDGFVYLRKSDVHEIILLWTGEHLCSWPGFKRIENEEDYVRKNVSNFSSFEYLTTSELNCLTEVGFISFPAKELIVDGKSYIAITIHSLEEEALYNSLNEVNRIHIGLDESGLWKGACKSDVGRVFYSASYFYNK